MGGPKCGGEKVHKGRRPTGLFRSPSCFIIYAYADKPAPARERAKPSVLKQIRDAQKAPRPPCREKEPGKSKDGAEL
jgi:hypothetical protein